jgi:hypothetical protein
MSLITNNLPNESFESILDYQFNLSGGSGSGVNAFNVNIDIGKNTYKTASFATWNSSTKKLLINDNGKYKLSTHFRINASIDTKSLTPPRYDLELWVNGSISSYLYIHGPTGSVTFSYYPFYNDSDAVGAGTGTTPYNVTSVTSTILTANGYYHYSNDFDLQSGSEIYLKSYNTTANYSSPTRTAPEGSVKIQNLRFYLEKIR